MKRIPAILAAAALLLVSNCAFAKIIDERIYLIPTGEIDRQVLDNLKSRIPALLPMASKVEIDQKKEVSEDGYDSIRKQYSAEMVLSYIANRVTLDTLNESAIVVTDVDLYSQDLDYVFGFADAKKVMAVVSLARLRNEFYGLTPDDKLFRDRALKEAVHQLGHAYGLSDCKNPRCVMYFSKEVSGIDKKQERFCIECDKALRHRYGKALFGSLTLW